jgi:hypothetical protein
MVTLNTVLKFLLLSIILSTSSAFGSEIDSFTHRYDTKLSDSQDIIHQKANQLLREALVLANSKNKGCSEKNLYKNLRLFFKNHMSGKLTPFIIHSPLVSKYVMNFADSIYRDFKWYDAFSIIFIQTIYKNMAGPIVRMGSYYIGSDKFEHMFGRGFKYFEKYYLKQKSLENVLKFGHRSERIFLGANTTGVYSYADLSANFNGMRFWNNMLGKNPDILGAKFQVKPYVRCDENEQWVQNNHINFLDYIDNSFDEAINCSKFRNTQILSKVLNQIDNLERNKGQNYTCPITMNSIQDLELKYQEVEKEILNFNGHASLGK